jgi:hypothetical protein
MSKYFGRATAIQTAFGKNEPKKSLIDSLELRRQAA